MPPALVPKILAVVLYGDPMMVSSGGVGKLRLNWKDVFRRIAPRVTALVIELESVSLHISTTYRSRGLIVGSNLSRRLSREVQCPPKRAGHLH